MSDILEAVEAKNVQSRQKAADAKKQEQKRQAVLQASAKATIKQKHLRVLGALLIRVLAALTTVAGLWVSMQFGLIKPVLAIPVICAVLMWASTWFGAWLQYTTGKEGLFK